MPAAIALVMAVVAGAAVWLVWSVIENLAAARKAKRAAPTESKADQG